MVFLQFLFAKVFDTFTKVQKYKSAKVFDTFTMADLMIAGVLSTDFSLACPCESTLVAQKLY